MKLKAGPEDTGTRLDVFLSRKVGGWTRSQLQVLNRRGGVRVDRSSEKDGYRLRGSEVIELDVAGLGPEVDRVDVDEGIEPEAIPLTVHYEDDSFAVVEKPAGMVVHPGAGNRRGTLVHALRARFPLLSDAGGVGRPGIVHRLDRWTSGLIVVAKTNLAHARIAGGFEKRNVRKVYLTAVHGRVSPESGRIDLAIGRHPTRRTRMVAGTGKGRTALSEYRMLEQAPGFSLLDVGIRTGRTHQIRVHMASIGHPVVGDAVYGEKVHRSFQRRHGPLDRYFLHAATLGFEHPDTGEWMEFCSRLPGELSGLWRRLSGAC